jgi:hypothetical protein
MGRASAFALRATADKSFARDDSKYSHSAFFARVLQSRWPSPNRGRRESRAPTAPASPCAMGRENAHGFDRYNRDIPAFPAQWLYGLYVLSPVSGLYCHRCQARTGGPDRRQGRGARTTRLRRTRRSFVRRRTRPLSGIEPSRLRLPRPSHPHPTFVTIAKRPSCGCETDPSIR